MDDPEVIRLTVLFVWLLGIMQPLMALEFALGGALQQEILNLRYTSLRLALFSLGLLSLDFLFG